MVVVTFNSATVVGGLLTSLAPALGSLRHRVIVVDNNSADDTLLVVERELPGATIVRMAANAGYAAAVNRAASDVGPDDALLVLNPDVRLRPGSVAPLVSALQAQGAGIAVPALTAPDGHREPSLRRRPSVLRILGEAVLGGHRAGRWALTGEMMVDEKHYRSARTVDWATGAVMLVSGRCLEAIGPFDESFFLYSEETEFCLRARASGFATRFVPEAQAEHIGGNAMVAPPLYTLLTLNRLRLFRRLHGRVATAGFAAGLLLNELLRMDRPVHRAALASLVSGRARRQVLSPLPPRPPVPDYVCFSAQDWWYHNRAHSDFQLMRRVARTRRVLFVNSIGLRMPSRTGSAPPLRRILRKARSVAKFVRRPDEAARSFVVMTPVVLPLYERPLVRRLNALLVRAQVRAVATVLGLRDLAVVVTVPTAVDVVEGMPHRALLFNRSDKHSEYEEADQGLIATLEERLLRAADSVLYVSRELMREDAPLVDGRAVFIDHGVDLDHFRRRSGPELPPDLLAVPGPRIGFFGGLDDYVVDFELLVTLASCIPEASVVLIGDAGAPMDRLTAVPNIYWLGHRPYEQIPAYGSGFDVAIMPWLQNRWIRFCNPIKTKEYLALGLPVVSMEYPEGHEYDQLIRWASTAEEFVEQVRMSLADGGPSTPEERRRAVSSASWESRASLLIDLAEGR